jgi:small neutral amino acid transporter SnatA (MarC family)
MKAYDISNISFSQILTASFALFAVIDVLGSIPVFIEE